MVSQEHRRAVVARFVELRKRMWYRGGEVAEDWQPEVNLKNAAGRAKVQLQLVPMTAVIETASAMEEGADKYGPFNWRREGAKVELLQYLRAILAHAYAVIDGEDIDPESANGKSHIAGILASAAIIVDARENGTLVDDRVPGQAGPMLRKRNR